MFYFAIQATILCLWLFYANTAEIYLQILSQIKSIEFKDETLF